MATIGDNIASLSQTWEQLRTNWVKQLRESLPTLSYYVLDKDNAFVAHTTVQKIFQDHLPLVKQTAVLMVSVAVVCKVLGLGFFSSLALASTAIPFLVIQYHLPKDQSDPTLEKLQLMGLALTNSVVFSFNSLLAQVVFGGVTLILTHQAATALYKDNKALAQKITTSVDFCIEKGLALSQRILHYVQVAASS